MKKRSDAPNADGERELQELRNRIIGFGERSARKSFYPELRESEERFRAVFEGAAIGMGVVDADGRLQDTNRALQVLLGNTTDELRGRPYLSLVHPEDRARFGEHHSTLLRRETDRTSLDVRLLRDDGEVLWAQVTASMVDGTDGSAASIVATMQDISLRKRAREALEFLSRASVTLATSLDVRGTLENLASLAVPHLGDLCAIWIHGGAAGRDHRIVASVDRARKALADELLAGGELAAAFRMRAGDTPAFVDDASAPAGGADGDPARRELLRRLDVRSSIALPLEWEGWSGTLLLATGKSGRRYGEWDLGLATEFGHRAALALDNATLLLRAEEASRLKDEFLAVVSHELRTPLTSILGWMHLLQTKYVAVPDASRGLSVVERNARALAQIIDDLISVSQIVAGKLDIRPARMDLASVVQHAVEALLPSAASRCFAVHVRCEPGLPDVNGDARRLQQVVWNLVSNGIKYTPEGGEVRVDLVRAGSSAELTVTDTGCGIGPQFLPHVFDRFRQEDGSSTRCHGGLGLGLAIVRHLVELHGGTVRAASEGEDRGACFTVTLPLARREEAAERPESDSPESALPALSGAERRPAQPHGA